MHISREGTSPYRREKKICGLWHCQLVTNEEARKLTTDIQSSDPQSSGLSSPLSNVYVGKRQGLQGGFVESIYSYGVPTGNGVQWCRS